MEISGLLTEDLPTKHFRAPSVSPPPYDRCVAPAAQSLDELKQSLFHCPTHSRIPLRLELRPTLTSTDLDTLVRTFFGLKPGDVISYGMGDQCYSTVGYEECLRTPEFQIHVTPDLRYQLHPFAHSQANLRHPSAHISGYGGPGTRAQLVSPYVQTRSSSPNSGRGHRTGSANSGRPLSLKRPYFGHAHPPVARHVDCYDQDYQQAPHHPQTAMHTIEGKLCKVEPLSSAEISLDNIVEGSRRKRTKFSSAELPLFPKPLHPASYSPPGALNNPQMATPLHNNQYGYYQQLTPNSASSYSYGSRQPPPPVYIGRIDGSDIPTPAPTIATDISDEDKDVALQLMRLGEAPSTSQSPSQNDETADDDANYSEGEGDDHRSDTTELPELYHPLYDEDYEDEPEDSPSYPKKQQRYKSLDEILPSYDSTIPSDNEETQCQTPATATQEQYYQPQNPHHHHHHHHQHYHHEHAQIPPNHEYQQYAQHPQQIQHQRAQYAQHQHVQNSQQQHGQHVQHVQHLQHQHAQHSHEVPHMDSADEEEFDYDDAHDETFVLDKDEDEGVDFIDDEHLPLSRTSNAVQKNGTGTGKTKPRNRVKTGRIPKSQQSAPTKVKPKPTTSLYTAFTHANKAVVSKGPLSPASPTMHRNPSVTSNSHNSQLQQSRSTTASSSLPTPISGIIHQHPDSLASAPTLITVTQEEESEKPKPRCQRCRKSKKGCDRQRPCQRCKDAGIGIEGCISEDETGTRRGRAGGAKKAGGATTGTAVKKVTKPKKKVVAKVAV